MLKRKNWKVSKNQELEKIKKSNYRAGVEDHVTERIFYLLLP